MMALLESIPFIGKHKRVVGAFVMALSGVLRVFDIQPALAESLLAFGASWYGVGELHARNKAKRAG